METEVKRLGINGSDGVKIIMYYIEPVGDDSPEYKIDLYRGYDSFWARLKRVFKTRDVIRFRISRNSGLDIRNFVVSTLKIANISGSAHATSGRKRNIV